MNLTELFGMTAARKPYSEDLADDRPVTLRYFRNKTPAPTQVNHYHGQDIEPHGQYFSQGDLAESQQAPHMEWGEKSFQRPLRLFSPTDDPSHPDHWKQQLVRRYNGATGKKLSDAIRRDGYDAILTHDEYGTSESVDLAAPRRKTAAPGEESQHLPPPAGFPDNNSYTHEQGVHRGLSITLPPHIHAFVHDPNQPPAAKAHLLLSEVKKQQAKNDGPEGEDGSVGGLGNYWSPSPNKGAEYASQSADRTYRAHEREHNCGDEETGDGGCPTTHVVIHADTPPEKHHWTENFRDGEQYDPQISWRLPVRPGAPINVRGVSWREGKDHWSFGRQMSDEGFKHHTTTPFTRYDFAKPVRKKAAGEPEGPELRMEPGAVVCRAITRVAENDEATQRAIDETSGSWHTTLHYDAENRWADNVPQRRYSGLREAQGHADEIADKEGVPRVLVGRNSHGPKWSFYQASHSANDGGPVIALGDDHLHEAKLIHEMAHHVHTLKGEPDNDDHGNGFTDRYSKMLRAHHSGGGQAAFGFIQSYRETRHKMVNDNGWEKSYTFNKPYPPVPESEKPKPYEPPAPEPDKTGELANSGYTWREGEKEQTGGMKWPYKSTIIAEHPDHGEVGRLTYFTPKRKGGIARVDNVEVHPDHRRKGLASFLMDTLQTLHPGSRMNYGGPNNLNDEGAAWLKGYQKGKRVTRGRTMAAVTFGQPPRMGEDNYEPDDEGHHRRLWDEWHPRVNPEIHRQLSVALPSGHPAHNEKLPMEERARAVMQHVITKGNVGVHWTDDPRYDHLSSGRLTPGETAVTLHVKKPPRSHIEDNSWTLEDRAVRDWDMDPEREVPMKRNAPLELTGVTWHSVKGPVRHDFASPIRVKALLDEEKRPQTRWMGGVPQSLSEGGDGDGGDSGDGGSVSSSTASRETGVDNEGHDVTLHPQDGWQHADGSHSHDDGSTISDHPVYTRTHTWLPHGRYWGPNSEQNDQRLFDGDHLKPEIRAEIMGRMNGFMRPKYREWPSWTKVYFAGSEAAKWQPFNGDFDILVGIEYEGFRKNNPQYADLDNVEISKMLTDGMRQEINADGFFFTLKDGSKVGPFDRTFYVNPDSYDIRRLKPYAAYDVSDDTWAVKPLEVPKDWDATHLPESYWSYAESLLHEIEAIGTLPPQERQRMAANLWDELHTHRSDAFGPEGKGMFDLSNIVEKYLDQHPDKPWAQLLEWKNGTPEGEEPWVPMNTLSSLFAEAASDGADYDGIMIAIKPPQRVGRKLLVEDGEPLEALHVTLCYLGGSKEHTKVQRDGLESLVRSWARQQKPFTAKVGGVGTFVNPGSHVLWAAVDIPGGGAIRHSLDELLVEHGYKVRNDHGWTPHITLKYHDNHVRFLPKVEPMTWDVREIQLCVGSVWTPISLGG